jgi:hypothetical protein
MHPPDPLRLCTACPIAHYENCGDCFGFGVYDGATNTNVPVRAADALDGIVPAGARPCPVCGSTITGAPTPPQDSR